MTSDNSIVESDRGSLRSNWRTRAGALWLGILFRLADRLPAVARMIRPLVVIPAWCFSRKIRQTTAANARRILGSDTPSKTLRRFGVGVTGCFYDVVCEIGRSARCQPEELIARIESVEGLDAYHAARESGKGAVILTAHMGSFEVGLAALRQYESHLHVVFKRDASGRFERLRAALRQRLQVREAPVDEGWAMWMKLRDALGNNEVVAIQGDRVMPGQRGTPMPILRGHLMLPPGPMKLALAANAPIIPIFTIRGRRDKISIFIEPPIHVVAGDNGDPVATALAAWARVLEKYIARYPRQWLMLEKAFDEDL